MLYQYALVNNCIRELKLHCLPPHDTLRLEIELIQLKKLLLDDQLEGILLKDKTSELAFTDLHRGFQRLGTYGSASDVDSILALLTAVKQDLMSNISVRHGSNTDWLCATDSANRRPEIVNLMRRLL